MATKARAALNYGLSLRGAPYRWWTSGPVPDGSPAWAKNGPPPSAETVRAQGCFCAGVTNLILRHAGREIPTKGNPLYDGGTVAYRDYYRDRGVLQKFVHGKRYPEGTLIGRVFRDSRDQGHVAIVLANGNVLQSYDAGEGRPGVNSDVSLAASDAGGYYEWAVPVESWLGPLDEARDPGGVKPGAVAIIDKHLLGNGAVIYEEATRAGLDPALAAALVDHESIGGQNIFGADHGETGDRPPYCNHPVTRERVQALRDGGNYTHGMNGVGLSQITWWTFVEEAEKLGGAHVPRNQCRVGFAHLSDLIVRLGYVNGIAAYNAGEGNYRLGITNGYYDKVAGLHAVWKERLAGAAPPKPAPVPPKPPQPGPAPPPPAPLTLQGRVETLERRAEAQEERIADLEGRVSSAAPAPEDVVSPPPTEEEEMQPSPEPATPGPPIPPEPIELESPGKGPKFEPVLWGTAAKFLVLLFVAYSGVALDEAAQQDLATMLAEMLPELATAAVAYVGIWLAERQSVKPMAKIEGS